MAAQTPSSVVISVERVENSVEGVEKSVERVEKKVDTSVAELRYYFDVATEATKHEVRLVAESVAHVNEELERKTNALRQEMSRGFAETQAGIADCGLRIERQTD